jgi:hypothetical protein
MFRAKVTHTQRSFILRHLAAFTGLERMTESANLRIAGKNLLSSIFYGKMADTENLPSAAY